MYRNPVKKKKITRLRSVDRAHLRSERNRKSLDRKRFERNPMKIHSGHEEETTRYDMYNEMRSHTAEPWS